MGEKVAEKIEIYDTLGILVPGILLITWLPLCYPRILAVPVVKFPDAFAAVALLALALFAGHIVQALGSLIQPILSWMWRGTHSNRVFCSDNNPCLKPGVASRIRAKLATRSGEDDDGALYQFAASIAESTAGSRVAKFNALYAFHRGLLVLILLVVATLPFTGPQGIAANWSIKVLWIAYASLFLLCLLVFNRTRQRAVYYVREVVLTAERVIDATPATPASAPPAPGVPDVSLTTTPPVIVPIIVTPQVQPPKKDS